MNNYYFLIHAPGGIAGGCESLHQLCDTLVALGAHASMCYYPHEQNFTKPKKFNMYNVDVLPFKDEENIVHIFPEIYTKLSDKVKKGFICIFWLSIDNYYYKKDNISYIEKKLRYYLSLLTTRLPLHKMRTMVHLMQSEYSVLHFANMNFKKFYIGDYIFYDNLYNQNESRKDIILYNPAKGLHITKKLIKLTPHLEFLPLKGFNSLQLKKIMRTAKIYIDFGNHPGRDRLPREFVLDGGVLICGMRGSAGNDKDIPIPTKYKVDDTKSLSLDRVQNLFQNVIENFECAQKDMSDYRNIIINDKEDHSKNVSKLYEYFNKIN